MPKIITPDGVEHNLTDLDFEVEEERWVEIKIKDGSVIKFRTTIESVGRSDKNNDDGTPIYFIKTQNHMRYIKIPPELVTDVKPKRIDTLPGVAYR